MTTETTERKPVGVTRVAGKYLTFNLSEESYGIDVLKVREIIRLAAITAVPQMPPHIRGVINLRGKIIPVMDLRVRFDFTAGENTGQTCIIVVQVKLPTGKSTQMSDGMRGVLIDPRNAQEKKYKIQADEDLGNNLDALQSVFSAHPEVALAIKDLHTFDDTTLNPSENKVMELSLSDFKGAMDYYSGTYLPYRQQAYEKLDGILKSIDTINRQEAQAAVYSRIIGLAVVALIIVVAIMLARVQAGKIQAVLVKNLDSLREVSEQVTQAASNITGTSHSLAEGSSEQAASIEETGASLEEMTSVTKRNAENAEKANDLAKQTRAAAERGAEDIQAMSAAMDAIKNSSDDIAKIIKTIDEIAFQTNILALNAAGEAARAGEAGMGFAVVADEVRNLAQRSAQAAKETAAKIEGAIGNTARGVELSSKVDSTLNEIVTKARAMDELAAEVAGASREQTQGITQINSAVGQMDKVTQSNAASAEESAAAAQQLDNQAQSMKHAVDNLLQLVGKASSSAAPIVTTATSHRPPPKDHRAKANGHLSATPAANGRASEIPLESFRDF